MTPLYFLFMADHVATQIFNELCKKENAYVWIIIGCSCGLVGQTLLFVIVLLQWQCKQSSKMKADNTKTENVVKIQDAEVECSTSDPGDNVATQSQIARSMTADVFNTASLVTTTEVATTEERKTANKLTTPMNATKRATDVTTQSIATRTEVTATTTEVTDTTAVVSIPATTNLMTIATSATPQFPIQAVSPSKRTKITTTSPSNQNKVSISSGTAEVSIISAATTNKTITTLPKDEEAKFLTNEVNKTTLSSTTISKKAANDVTKDLNVINESLPNSISSGTGEKIFTKLEPGRTEQF
ncbi:uncharacterized protein LOC131939609 [Physella acuta]|uniref:uncharacterized protein LOC131939609 n=1 Tax=Physella acuta TaxID=109671 RepID=UPI0027DCDF4A|nr:uncharacterized protein LOC131939609 [Physella acuta]XP_059154002.1 uncharacterized protein LOC131939609 [Physella acuta]